eukprot:TRINITY_DN31315_c0_g1_i2.p2 TRINITY_DN31315_c0_g1~~TRINITY_DN31315_c0_g1_i2.p2  ORF type:complete len:306 (+),score=61.71 TRINITY_DN31315_c0_g1_i2:51-968(+)
MTTVRLRLEHIMFQNLKSSLDGQFSSASGNRFCKGGFCSHAMRVAGHAAASAKRFAAVTNQTCRVKGTCAAASSSALSGQDQSSRQRALAPGPCLAAARRVLSGLAQSTADARINTTRRWFDEVVLAEKLCPFAPPVRDAPQLRIVASEAASEEQAIEEIARQAAALKDGILRPEAGLPETTLVVYERSLSFVAAWQDLVRLSWRLQSEAILANGLQEDLQLVLFHPEAVHSAYGEGPPDAADYSIRAPYPTVHLLREMDVLSAVAGYPQAEQIPARNKARLRAQGLDACAARLTACYDEQLAGR